MDIGQRIKILRAEAQLTLPGLADKAGISKGLLYQLENSESPNPSLDTLNKIAKALGVTIATLLERGGIRAKRIIPDRIDEALQAMIEAIRKEKMPLNQGAVEALYALQEREGSPKTAEDWKWLYDTIVLKLNQGKK